MIIIKNLLNSIRILLCLVLEDHLLQVDIDIDIELTSANHVRDGDHVQKNEELVIKERGIIKRDEGVIKEEEIKIVF
jgi:hypothetical protein